MVMFLFVVFGLYVVYQYGMGSNNGKHYEGYTEGVVFGALPQPPGLSAQGNAFKMNQAAEQAFRRAQNEIKNAKIFGKR